MARHVFGGFEQLLDLLIGIEVGFGTTVAIRQQAFRRNLRRLGLWHSSNARIRAPRSIGQPIPPAVCAVVASPTAKPAGK